MYNLLICLPISFFLLQALPHSRRETTDSLNDETFGSADDTSEDRAEEEKKRRGVFLLVYTSSFEHVVALTSFS